MGLGDRDQRNCRNCLVKFCYKRRALKIIFTPFEVFDSMSLNVFPSIRQVILPWVSHIPVTTLVHSNLLPPHGTYRYNRFSF